MGNLDGTRDRVSRAMSTEEWVEGNGWPEGLAEENDRPELLAEDAGSWWEEEGEEAVCRRD